MLLSINLLIISDNKLQFNYKMVIWPIIFILYQYKLRFNYKMVIDQSFYNFTARDLWFPYLYSYFSFISLHSFHFNFTVTIL